jgi:hypothetical protein
MMILTKTLPIRINNKNIGHYLDQNIDVVYGQVYEMDIKYVSRYSKYKILAKCESCGAEKELPMQKYHQNWDRSGSYNCKACNNITLKKSMMEKYGYDNPSRIPDSVEKRKKTCLEKYGTEYVIASEYSKDKTRETLLERFGGHQTNDPDIKNMIIKKGKETKVRKGYVAADEDLSEWDLYRRKVRNLTNQSKKRLFEEWDGYDYYDGEYIGDNLNRNLKHTDNDYPTIDHKISVIYGFNNDMSPEEIGSIENLCITKKGINSSKSFRIEEDYLNKKSQS